MATNKVLVVTGTPILFADHATDFAYPATDPLAANNIILGTPTPKEVQMNFSVIAAAAAWQSAKLAAGDIVVTGSSWPEEWILGACMESTATPAANGTFDFYWNPTPNPTAGDGNSGGCSGTDAAYTAAAQAQLIYIGSMVVRANVINISANIGTLRMTELYGSLVMFNNTSVAMVADADADQCYAVLTPKIPDIQAAA